MYHKEPENIQRVQTSAMTAQLFSWSREWCGY